MLTPMRIPLTLQPVPLVKTLLNSKWIKGPEFLWQPDFEPKPYVNGPSVAIMPEEIITVNVTINSKAVILILINI